MYRVTVTTDGVEYSLHEPNDDEGELVLLDPVIEQEIGKNGLFTFQVPYQNPNRDKILALRSEISVYDNEELIFCGRHIGHEKDFYNVGRVTCEGELAYLVDSIQRPYDFTGGCAELFRQLLGVHNSQVEERKRFEVGVISAANVSAEMRQAETECKNTREAMAQLALTNGGYLRVRRQGGKKYLDYVSDYGGINSQAIRFGENLLDMTQYAKPTTIITALLPYGAAIEPDDPEAEAKKLDITSVNGGKDYIFDQSAVDTYGWIYGTQTFDGVTDPVVLLEKARAYLQEAIVMPVTIDVNAVDLGLVDVEIDKLKLGYWTTVESVPHGINKRFMLTKKTRHLDSPAMDSIILGKMLPTMTGNASKNRMEISDRVNKVASNLSKDIVRKIKNATDLITGGLGGYVILDVDDPITGKRALPWRILIMDAPDKDAAVSVIQINKNGIGFSRTGINGPYENAWTIDGNLVADFITTGTMLADRIRGGILEIGGSGIGRDGRVVVKDAEDKEIGYWDKTGFHVLLGVIEGSVIRGSEIRGSEIVGGMINIGNGTFVVDRDGSVSIGSGEISIGKILLTENYSWLGDFGISNNQGGAFYSRDTGHSVEIISTDCQFDTGPAINLRKGNVMTRVGWGGIRTGDISFTDPWTEDMSALDMFRDLYNRVNILKERINDLEG